MPRGAAATILGPWIWASRLREQGPREPPLSISPPRILVVDDSELILETLPGVLGVAFEVQTCSNPMLIASMLRKEQVDLLLLDVDMPAISGPQVVQALRRSDCLVATKVVLYSARKGPALQELCRSCGATAAITKDVTGEDLIETLEALLDEPKSPGASTETFFVGVSAIVFANPPLEGRLVELLAGLGILSQRRGVLGIDRVLREASDPLVVVEARAFEDLPALLTRLRARGVVQTKGVLVVGECPGERCVSVPLDRAVLKDSIRAVLPKRVRS